MFCTRCGSELLKNASFCHNCGAKITTDYSNVTDKITDKYDASDNANSSIQSINVQDSVYSLKSSSLQDVSECTEIKSIKTNDVDGAKDGMAKSKRIGCILFGTLIIIIALTIALLIQNRKGNDIQTSNAQGDENIEGVFWIENPITDIETEMNKAITEYYGSAGVNASEKGYLITDFESNKTEDDGTFITAKYGPESVIGLTALLNEDGEIVSIFTFYYNIGAEPTTEQIMGIYANLALTAVLHDKQYSDISKQTELLEKIINQNPDGEQNEGETEAVLVDGNCEYSISMSEYMFGFQIRDLSKVSESSESVDSSDEDNLSTELNTDEVEEYAAEGVDVHEYAANLFQSIIGDLDEANYDDLSCEGSIIVCKVEPSEDYNFASYYIAGRGFSPIYDTDCIEVDNNNYYFYQKTEFWETYYRIEVNADKIDIYYGDAKDNCTDLTGSFSIK